VRYLAAAAFAGACVLACGKAPVTLDPLRFYDRAGPACDAARREQKPVLFVWAADWDLVTKEIEHRVLPDGRVRRVLARDYIALEVDRTRSYADDYRDEEERAIVEEARDRFKPWQSTYGSVFIVAENCETRIDDLSQTFHPSEFAAELESGVRTNAALRARARLRVR
jgi:hypothetical protein